MKDKPGPKPRSREEVLEIILDCRVYTDHITGCWIWRLGQWNSGNGYGKIWIEGKALMVHRFVWIMLKGKIPAGMILDHKCRRRACCNPNHLRLITPQYNTYAGLAVLFSKTKAEHI